MCIRCLCAGENLGGNVFLHMLSMLKEVQEKSNGGLEKKTTCGFKDNMWLMGGPMSIYDLGQKFHLIPAEVTLLRFFPPLSI